MRITDMMLFDRAAVTSGSARERVEGATEQLSTGLRVQHPGDDPIAAGLDVGARVNADRFDAIGTTADRARQELTIADDTLGQLGNVLDRARELATQLSNDSYDATARSAGGTEVNGLIAQALALLNTRAGDRYLFGGTKDDQPPFDAAGNYVGSTTARQVEIAPGVLQQSSVTGDVIAKTNVDVTATLKALATALTANDSNAVRATLDGLSTSVEQVANARGQVGTAVNTLETATWASRVARDAQTAAASKLVDADPIEAASKLALAQRALDAALTASAQSFNLTLLDKMR